MSELTNASQTSSEILLKKSANENSRFDKKVRKYDDDAHSVTEQTKIGSRCDNRTYKHSSGCDVAPSSKRSILGNSDTSVLQDIQDSSSSSKDSEQTRKHPSSLDYCN